MTQSNTEETIKKLKERIADGWAMANDPMCSDGFAAADRYIRYLEEELRWCKNKLKEYYGD